MRVGVDATSWVNRRGFGRFARNAVGRLVELDSDATYVLFVDEENARDATLPESAERRAVSLSRAPSQAAAAGSSRSVRDLLRLGRAVRRDKLDAFLFPSVYTYFPVIGVPTVVGVHDAIIHELPELTVPDARARMFSRAKEALALRLASRVFTVSEASRQALAKRLGLRPERVAIVPEAPDPVFTPRSGEEIAAARTAAGIDSGRPFFVFAGGISPHKNVETLLEAFASPGSGRETGPLLVLVGELDDDPYLSATASVRRRIAELGLDGRVLLPGFVSDDVLAGLYSGAHAVVIPSLAEGFGLPAVEGAACGAALVLSDLPAHRETLDGSALFFPPREPRALARELERLLDDDALRTRLQTEARAAVARLTWDHAAERLRELVGEAARNGRNG